MTGTIDITCSLPAPTLAQVRAWLTRTGWTECQVSKAVWPVPRWTHPRWNGRSVYIYDITFASAEMIQDIALALGEPSTPESVYREIMGQPRVWVARFPLPSVKAFDVFATRDSAEHAASFCDGATVEEREVRP